MSDSVQPHRRQPTRLPRPWGSPGKNTGMGCHFLLQCRKVKNESEVAQSCQTLRDHMDCSPSGSSIRGIFQARVLQWGAIALGGFKICSEICCLFVHRWSLSHVQLFCDSVDCSPTRSFVQISQARILEWAAISSSLLSFNWYVWAT